MNVQGSRISRLAASVLIFFNFLAMVLCITAFAFSLWVTASPGSFANAVKNYGNPTLKALLPEDALSLQMGVGAALLSGFFFFISFMGFYGALTVSQFLLFMYATLVILLLLLECAVIFYVSSDLVEKGIHEPDDFTAHAIRLALRCCEQNGTSSTPDVIVPWSCCGAEAYPKNCTLEQVYPTSCHEAIVTWQNRCETPVYIGLTTFHVLMSFCSLLRRALSASHSYT